MRDKLVELIEQALIKRENLRNDFLDEKIDDIPDFEDVLADHLIENGVIVPPCKIGDIVWVMFYRWGKYEIESRKILSVQFYHSGAIQYHCKDGCFYQSEIGKTVFLTREEAERKGGE